VRLDSALATAQASGLAPSTTNPNSCRDVCRRERERRAAVRRHRRDDRLLRSHGDRLRLPININQFILGTTTRPFPTLSASSPILPGSALGNITEVESAGWSNYKACG